MSTLRNSKFVSKKDATPVSSTKRIPQSQSKGEEISINSKADDSPIKQRQDKTTNIVRVQRVEIPSNAQNSNENTQNTIPNQAESFSDQKQWKNMSNGFQSTEWNCSFVDNLLQQRGYGNAKVVPIELFQEAMNYLECRINGMEQRIEDNEQQTKLNDRLLDLRNIVPSASFSNSMPSDQQTFWSQKKHSQGSLIGQNNNNNVIEQLSKKQQHNNAQFQNGSQEYQDNLVQQQKQQQQHQQIVEQCENKLNVFEKKLLHFEENVKQFSSDIDRKFSEYSKKLNTQLDRFFKAAQQKMEASNEKEQRISAFEENVTQQIELIKQTFLLREEEINSSKEAIEAKVQGLAEICGKVENRLSEHGLELNETKTLLKQIEDDLFVMLQNHKDLQDAIHNYRSIYDDIAQLKNTQAGLIHNRQQSKNK